MSDWVVTIPKTIKWEDWLREVKHAKEKKEFLFFKIPIKAKCLLGEQCFVVHNGFVKGFLTILKVETLEEGFTCTTTGKKWPPSHYLVRYPNFIPMIPEIPMKGFQGIRKFILPKGDHMFLGEPKYIGKFLTRTDLICTKKDEKYDDFTRSPYSTTTNQPRLSDSSDS